MSTHHLPFLARVGYRSTPETPILDNFGPPTKPRIGRSRYPTFTGIIRGPVFRHTETRSVKATITWTHSAVFLQQLQGGRL